MNGLDSIAAERRRQIDAEGFNTQHDDQYKKGELARAAACYAIAGARQSMDGSIRDKLMAMLLFIWPDSWSWGWWKPNHDRFDLVRAGALIVAEIDRLDRAEEAERENKVIDHLTHAASRDAEKGGIGTRTTREVADRSSLSLLLARNTLSRLWEKRIVEKIEGGHWRLAQQTPVNSASNQGD